MVTPHQLLVAVPLWYGFSNQQRYSISSTEREIFPPFDPFIINAAETVYAM